MKSKNLLLFIVTAATLTACSIHKPWQNSFDIIKSIHEFPFITKADARKELNKKKLDSFFALKDDFKRKNKRMLRREVKKSSAVLYGNTYDVNKTLQKLEMLRNFEDVVTIPKKIKTLDEMVAYFMIEDIGKSPKTTAVTAQTPKTPE